MSNTPDNETKPESTAQTEEPKLPDPTLATLATMLGMQAMHAIGVFNMPGHEKSEPRPAEARHLIDLIEMLVAKTEGNRTPEESKELDDILHGLRMVYVNTMQQHRMDETAKNAS